MIVRALSNQWYAPQPPRARPTAALDKLRRFSEFRNGWAFGEGRAFPAAAIDGAEEILQQALQSGLCECDVFPGRNGQIIVTIYLGNESFDFAVRDEGPHGVSLTHEVDGEEIDQHATELSIADAVVMLGGCPQWPSSELFIQTNTRATTSVLRLVRSSPQTTAEFR